MDEHNIINKTINNFINDFIHNTINNNFIMFVKHVCEA